MDGLVMAAQIILSLSILVGIHEAGHMVAAKFFGMRVEQFSIGFPPKIFGFKKGETEYSLGSIPLGGFVKISGMVDESLDTKNLKEEPQPWEFRSKPAWQRLIVMLGGIIMNVVTGIIIFVVLVYHLGEPYIPKSEVNEYGIVAYDLGEEIGLQTGDKILEVNGADYQKFTDITGLDVLLEDNSYYTVKRDGATLKVTIPNDFIEKFSEQDARNRFIEPIGFSQIAEVLEGGNAEQAGLLPGDIITQINGDTVFNYQINDIIKRNAGNTIDLTVKRSAEKDVPETEYNIVRQIPVTVGQDSLIGISHGTHYDFSYIDYNLGQSLVEGSGRAFSAVYVNIKAFGKILSGDLSPTKSLSGPIAIAQVFGGTWNWERFWSLTGLLSMVLAFMNLLPIPALDGGHVMFLLFEMVSGRKPSDKFLEVAQKIGMVLLLALMVFVIFNDIRKIVVDFFGL
ncbi:MAG: RIP metalloprotease RseP [Candidatus Cyclobacteriaceae bacterium M3_2C_046]